MNHKTMAPVIAERAAPAHRSHRRAGLSGSLFLALLLVAAVAILLLPVVEAKYSARTHPWVPAAFSVQVDGSGNPVALTGDLSFGREGHDPGLVASVTPSGWIRRVPGSGGRSGTWTGTLDVLFTQDHPNFETAPYTTVRYAFRLTRSGASWKLLLNPLISVGEDGIPTYERFPTHAYKGVPSYLHAPRELLYRQVNKLEVVVPVSGSGELLSIDDDAIELKVRAGETGVVLTERQTAQGRRYELRLPDPVQDRVYELALTVEEKIVVWYAGEELWYAPVDIPTAPPSRHCIQLETKRINGEDMTVERVTNHNADFVTRQHGMNKDACYVWLAYERIGTDEPNVLYRMARTGANQVAVESATVGWPQLLHVRYAFADGERFPINEPGDASPCDPGQRPWYAVKEACFAAPETPPETPIAVEERQVRGSEFDATITPERLDPVDGRDAEVRRYVVEWTLRRDDGDVIPNTCVYGIYATSADASSRDSHLMDTDGTLYRWVGGCEEDRISRLGAIAAESRLLVGDRDGEPGSVRFSLQESGETVIVPSEADPRLIGAYLIILDEDCRLGDDMTFPGGCDQRAENILRRWTVPFEAEPTVPSAEPSEPTGSPVTGTPEPTTTPSPLPPVTDGTELEPSDPLIFTDGFETGDTGVWTSVTTETTTGTTSPAPEPGTTEPGTEEPIPVEPQLVSFGDAFRLIGPTVTPDGGRRSWRLEALDRDGAAVLIFRVEDDAENGGFSPAAYTVHYLGAAVTIAPPDGKHPSVSYDPGTPESWENGRLYAVTFTPPPATGDGPRTYDLMLPTAERGISVASSHIVRHERTLYVYLPPAAPAAGGRSVPHAAASYCFDGLFEPFSFRAENSVGDTQVLLSNSHETSLRVCDAAFPDLALRNRGEPTLVVIGDTLNQAATAAISWEGQADFEVFRTEGDHLDPFTSWFLLDGKNHEALIVAEMGNDGLTQPIHVIDRGRRLAGNVQLLEVNTNDGAMNGGTAVMLSRTVVGAERWFKLGYRARAAHESIYLNVDAVTPAGALLSPAITLLLTKIKDAAADIPDQTGRIAVTPAPSPEPVVPEPSATATAEPSPTGTPTPTTAPTGTPSPSPTSPPPTTTPTTTPTATAVPPTRTPTATPPPPTPTWTRLREELERQAESPSPIPTQPSATPTATVTPTRPPATPTPTPVPPTATPTATPTPTATTVPPTTTPTSTATPTPTPIPPTSTSSPTATSTPTATRPIPTPRPTTAASTPIVITGQQPPVPRVTTKGAARMLPEPYLLAALTIKEGELTKQDSTQFGEINRRATIRSDPARPELDYGIVLLESSTSGPLFHPDDTDFLSVATTSPTKRPDDYLCNDGGLGTHPLISTLYKRDADLQLEPITVAEYRAFLRRLIDAENTAVNDNAATRIANHLLADAGSVTSELGDRLKLHTAMIGYPSESRSYAVSYLDVVSLDDNGRPVEGPSAMDLLFIGSGADCHENLLQESRCRVFIDLGLDGKNLDPRNQVGYANHLAMLTVQTGIAASVPAPTPIVERPDESSVLTCPWIHGEYCDINRVNYAVLRATEMPATLIEMFNLQNKEQLLCYLEEEKIFDFAGRVADAIDKHKQTHPGVEMVIIDDSHGSREPGAVVRLGTGEGSVIYREAFFATKAQLALQHELLGRGYQVRTLTTSLMGKDRTQYYRDTANAFGEADDSVYISLHVDSNPAQPPGATGYPVASTTKPALPPRVFVHKEEMAPGSDELARNILRFRGDCDGEIRTMNWKD